MNPPFARCQSYRQQAPLSRRPRGRDLSLTSAETAQPGAVNGSPPVVDILTPAAGATVPLGDSVLVSVHVTDIGGIKSISFTGVAIRRDPLNNTTVVTKYNAKSVDFPQAPQTALPKDTVITLSSSNSGVAKPTASSITISAGQTSKTFTVKIFAVSSTKTVKIKATAYGLSKEATLTVTN